MNISLQNVDKVSALLTLKYSSEPADVALYHKFCKFVIERPIRDSH